MSTNEQNNHQTKIKKDRGSTYSWLKGTPPSDGNFKSELKDADAETVRAVLADMSPENNSTRRKVLESRLRQLEKTTDKIVKPEKVLRGGLLKEKKALEEKGWLITETDGLWRGEKKFPFDAFVTKIDNAKSFPQLLEAAGMIELRSNSAALIKKRGDGTDFPLKTVVAIETARMTPSPFEPQARRRAKFKSQEIESLGDSIVRHGLAQPIGVRLRNLKYEIVFGERRWLGAKAKGLQTINCVVGEWTDAQALELQYEENHKRQINDPLDDAFFFKFLKERENYTDGELADRLGTTKQNVVDKLKLNDLIPEAVAELNGGKLPLKHAYYLAKFSPAVQREITNAQLAYKYHDRTEAAAAFTEFKEEVEENILRKLQTAPFDPADPRLHIKGLLCGDCPDNSEFAKNLFPDLAGDATCLNKSCFELKSTAHLRLQREAIALARPNPTNIPVDELVKDVPLVTDRKWTDETPFKEKPLTNQKFLPEPECEHSVLSLIVDGTRRGEETYICKTSACGIHNPKTQPDENERQKREVELQSKIEKLTREKILSKAIEFFDDYKPIWQFDDLIRKLIYELWISTGNDTLKPILRVIKHWKGLPKDSGSKEELENFLGSLDKAKQSRLIFLLIFKTEGFYSNSAQDGIKKLAADYARVDYRLLFAEARHELAPPEEKELAADILAVTRAGVNDLRAPDLDLGDAAH